MAQTGLWHARGPGRMREGRPVSAFSKGDLLLLTSTSSLSGFPYNVPAGALIAGVAAADSDNSFNDKVPYVIPTDEDVYWSLATAGSAMTVGQRVGFLPDANGRPVVDPSASTKLATIEEVQTEMDISSGRSKVLLRFISDVDSVLAHSG